MAETIPGPQALPSFTSHRLYPADEVDAHVQGLHHQIDDLRHALDEANERAAHAEHRAGNLDHAEERVGRAFVVAQEAADSTLREAELSAASVVTEARRRAELLLAKSREDALGVVESARKTVADLYQSTRTQSEDEEHRDVISLDEQPLAAVETTAPEFPWLADLKNEDDPARARAPRPPVAPSPEIPTPVTAPPQQPASGPPQTLANDPSAVFPPRKPRRARFGADRSGGSNGSAP